MNNLRFAFYLLLAALPLIALEALSPSSPAYAYFLTALAERLDALRAVVVATAALLSEVIAACAILAAALPKPEPDSPAALLRQLLDLAAFNIGHAKNRDVP